MELSLRFRIRPEQANGKTARAMLQIRLKVNGQAVSDYGSGVQVRVAKWHQKDQLVTGQTAYAHEINRQLEEIEARHREILRDLKRAYQTGKGPKPTAVLVKAEYLQPGASDPTLLAYLSYWLDKQDEAIGSEDERAEKTLDRYARTRLLLAGFLCHREGIDEADYKSRKRQPKTRLSEVTNALAKDFHVWLQVNPVTGTRRMQRDSATKHLTVLRQCLDYAVEERGGHNPIVFRPKRGKGKPVYFLADAHVERLLAMTTTDAQLGFVLWWARLMCYTGLDYVDAVRYARGRHRYEVATTAGVVVVITRSKPPRNECHIPRSPVVDRLFDEYPAGPPAPVLADLNRHLKVVQAAIGFTGNDTAGKPMKLTSKILRKTAGAIYLRAGYQISFVSKLLGHGSIRTTETFYTSVKALSMPAEMMRVRLLNEAHESRSI